MMSLPHTLFLPHTFCNILLDIVLYDVAIDVKNRLKGTAHFFPEGYCTELDALAAG
jgi:hypothetical protein